MKRNIKLQIEYDGTDFVGWQRQPNGRTVQHEIEIAIKRIIQEDSNIVGAGRTDSGVHARGQVANFYTERKFNIQEINRSLNGVLPEDIFIQSVEEVEETFSARYSAKKREYQYFISTVNSVFGRKYSWHLDYALDLDKMNFIARSIIGIHDFQSFCKGDSDVEHYRCEIFDSFWRKENSMLIYKVSANRFLHGMVRALVGTMVNVGRGFTTTEQCNKILHSKNRSTAGQAAPAAGLFLERVIY